MSAEHLRKFVRWSSSPAESERQASSRSDDPLLNNGLRICSPSRELEAAAPPVQGVERLDEAGCSPDQGVAWLEGLSSPDQVARQGHRCWPASDSPPRLPNHAPALGSSHLRRQTIAPSARLQRSPFLPSSSASASEPRQAKPLASELAISERHEEPRTHGDAGARLQRPGAHHRRRQGDDRQLQVGRQLGLALPAARERAARRRDTEASCHAGAAVPHVRGHRQLPAALPSCAPGPPRSPLHERSGCLQGSGLNQGRVQGLDWG